MARVVEDRVLDIVGGVAAACAQAKAWLMVTGNGMYDFAPQILAGATESAHKNSVIVSLYCMEDFATHQQVGGTLDVKAFDAEHVSDRVPGGRAFCESLHRFAGVANADEADGRPKVFVEEIDDVMQKFKDMQKQTVKPKMVEKKYKVKGKIKVEKQPKKMQQSCIQQLNKFFQDRAYLPAKDVTHLIVFQSRAVMETFKMLLEARVSTGNFLMEGSIDCMKMFDASMKTGRSCHKILSSFFSSSLSSCPTSSLSSVIYPYPGISVSHGSDTSDLTPCFDRAPAAAHHMRMQTRVHHERHGRRCRPHPARLEPHESPVAAKHAWSGRRRQ